MPAFDLSSIESAWWSCLFRAHEGNPEPLQSGFAVHRYFRPSIGDQVSGWLLKCNAACRVRSEQSWIDHFSPGSVDGS